MGWSPSQSTQGMHHLAPALKMGCMDSLGRNTDLQGVHTRSVHSPRRGSKLDPCSGAAAALTYAQAKQSCHSVSLLQGHRHRKQWLAMPERCVHMGHGAVRQHAHHLCMTKERWSVEARPRAHEAGRVRRWVQARGPQRLASGMVVAHTWPRSHALLMHESGPHPGVGDDVVDGQICLNEHAGGLEHGSAGAGACVCRQGLRS